MPSTRFVAMLDAAGAQSAPTQAEPVTGKDDMPMRAPDWVDASPARATLRDAGPGGDATPVSSDADKREDSSFDEPLDETAAAVVRDPIRGARNMHRNGTVPWAVSATAHGEMGTSIALPVVAIGQPLSMSALPNSTSAPSRAVSGRIADGLRRAELARTGIINSLPLPITDFGHAPAGDAGQIPAVGAAPADPGEAQPINAGQMSPVDAAPALVRVGRSAADSSPPFAGTKAAIAGPLIRPDRAGNMTAAEPGKFLDAPGSGNGRTLVLGAPASTATAAAPRSDCSPDAGAAAREGVVTEPPRAMNSGVVHRDPAPPIKPVRLPTPAAESNDLAPVSDGLEAALADGALLPALSTTEASAPAAPGRTASPGIQPSPHAPGPIPTQSGSAADGHIPAFTARERMPALAMPFTPDGGAATGEGRAQKQLRFAVQTAAAASGDTGRGTAIANGEAVRNAGPAIGHSQEELTRRAGGPGTDSGGTAAPQAVAAQPADRALIAPTVMAVPFTDAPASGGAIAVWVSQEPVAAAVALPGKHDADPLTPLIDEIGSVGAAVGGAPGSVITPESVPPSLGSAFSPDQAPPGPIAEIGRRMLRTLDTGDQDISLRVHLPGFGDLDLRLVVAGHDVSAWFHSPQSSLQQAISQGLGQLQLDLAGAGYDLNRAWVGDNAWTPGSRSTAPAAVQQVRGAVGPAPGKPVVTSGPIMGISIYV